MPKFVPRERKRRKLARAKTHEDHPKSEFSNSNADIILPEAATERESRRQALRDEIAASQPESRVSSKKRKRLDKYVETKLRKEEAADLVKKLARQKVDTSLLQSSKTLGRVHETQRDRLSRAVKERDAGIGDDTELLQARVAPEDEGGGSDTRESDQDGGGVTLTPTQPPTQQQTPFGSGLKRSQDGSAPVIKKRKRRKVEKPRDIPSEVSAEDDEEEWSGFSDDEQHPEAAVESDDASEEASTSVRSDSPDMGEVDNAKPRVSAFKQWADTLRNAALDFRPSADALSGTAHDKFKENFRPRQPSTDPLLQESTASNASTTAAAASIAIHRDEEIQTARMELPVVQEEQRIVEAINRNPVVVVCGATGSGKTTQIPQMLLENGYGSRIGASSNSTKPSLTPPQSRGIIGVTQPRRVAATSVAARVQHELGPVYGKRVAHQVRYDTNVRSDTAIKFMTDGILLREIQNDYVLSKYSIIVLDEAHERSVNTDILIGMLARIVPLRQQLSKEQPQKHYPLKLVIMSATLSQGVNSFLQNDKLWKSCGPSSQVEPWFPPVVSVEGRQYPVTVHFARKSRKDYVDEVVEKVARGHRKLPPGGILVFLTGQQEILDVMRKLKVKFGGTDNMRGDDYEDPDGCDNPSKPPKSYLEDDISVKSSRTDEDDELEIETDKDAEFSIPTEPDRPHQTAGILKPHILPLYAALPHSQQLKPFQQPPLGTRLIVLSTNVAETSLTIPNTRYVFDTGRAKQKHYNTSTGVQTFEVGLISRASAEQRKGRAGRTGPGHVWRLYSSNVYEELFEEETKPEILRTGLESVVLQLKAMDIKNVATFPFPTAPEVAALKKAEQLLKNLGALSNKYLSGRTNAITQVGRNLMRFPVHPRYGILLLLAQSNNITAHAIALVAALATGEMFIPEIFGQHHQDNAEPDEDTDGSSDSMSQHKREERIAALARRSETSNHQSYTRAQATLSKFDDQSDAIKMLIAVLAYSDPEVNQTPTFCKDYYLREKSMSEIQLLRRQLHSIVHGNGDSDGLKFELKLKLPKEREFQLLKQVVAAGFIDQVAIRSDLLPNHTTAFTRKPKRATEVAYRTLLPSLAANDTPTHANQMQEWEKEVLKSVFIHPSSVLTRSSVNQMPDYLIYSHLSRATQQKIDDGKVKKTRFHPLTPVSPKVLGMLAEGTPLLQVGKPIGKIEELPNGQLSATVVRRRQCWISVGLKAPGGDAQEWPLPPWKVIQRRQSGRDWEIEKVVAR